MLELFWILLDQVLFLLAHFLDILVRVIADLGVHLAHDADVGVAIDSAAVDLSVQLVFEVEVHGLNGCCFVLCLHVMVDAQMRIFENFIGLRFGLVVEFAEVFLEFFQLLHVGLQAHFFLYFRLFLSQVALLL